MAVCSIWEFRFPHETADEGFQVAQAIWQDMPHFDGYLNHRFLRDLDDPGHLLVVSRWRDRERADKVRDEYAGHPNARRADSLVTEPRRRFVAQDLGPAADAEE